MVGLLRLYSNHADQGKRLKGLFGLPPRANEPPRSVLERRRRPTKSETAAIVTGYQAGRTIQELANELGFHRETVSAALDRSGVPRRYHERVVVDLNEAAELAAQGLTVTEIAEALGIGRTTLIKARRQARS